VCKTRCREAVLKHRYTPSSGALYYPRNTLTCIQIHTLKYTLITRHVRRRVVGLIDACIGITTTILEIGRAVRDAQGLLPTLRDLCEKLPAIEDLLETARERCEDGKINENSKKTSKPILKQCEQALAELRDVFRKACPKDGDHRSKRIWKGARTVFFGRDGQVRKLLVSVQDNMWLLEQQEVFRIGDRLDELRMLTEALAHDDHGGITMATRGGIHTNYLMSGSGRQINNARVYNEASTNC
jgi:hypothetical protein